MIRVTPLRTRRVFGPRTMLRFAVLPASWTFGILTSIPLFILAGTLFLIQGQSLIATTDTFIPFTSAVANFNAYFLPWHEQAFGYPGSAPNSYFYSYVLIRLGASPAVAQHLLLIAPIVFAYFSSFALSRWLGTNGLVAAVVGYLYVCNAAFMNQAAGATGLLYVYAATPLVILFGAKLVQSKTYADAVLALSGLVLAMFAGTFELTEAILLYIVICTPLGLVLFLRLASGSYSLRRTLHGFLYLGAAFVVYLVATIFTYYPWLEAVFLPSAPAAQSILSPTTSQYLHLNIFAINSFVQTFPTAISPFILTISVSTPGLLTWLLTIGLILLVCFPIVYNRNWRFRHEDLYLCTLVYLSLCSAFLLTVVVSPGLAFAIFESFHLYPLLALTEPAVWFFVLVPWEVTLVALTLGSSWEMRHSPAGEQSQHSEVGTVSRRGKNWAAAGVITTVRFRVHKHGAILATIVVAILFTSSAAAGLPAILTAQSGNGSIPQINSDYGHYFSIPNHTPTYVEKLLNNFSSESATHGPFRVLWLPTAPGIGQWLEADPYAVFFPPSNQYVYSLFEAIVGTLNSQSSANLSNILNTLAIKYVVVLKALNESETGPTIANGPVGPFAILGNPRVMLAYLESQDSMRLVSESSDFALFEDSEYSGIIRAADIPLGLHPPPGPVLLHDQGTHPVNPPAGFNWSYGTSTNLIFDSGFSDLPASWSPFGPTIFQRQVRSNASTGLEITWNASAPGTGSYVSYNSIPPNQPNLIPVIPQQVYNFSAELFGCGNSTGQFGLGVDTYGLDGRSLVAPGYFLQGVSGIPSGQRVMVTDSIDTPANTFFIRPYLWVGNGFFGSIVITGVSLKLSAEPNPGNASAAWMLHPTNVSATDLERDISTLPGFGATVTFPTAPSSGQPASPVELYGYGSDGPGVRLASMFLSLIPVFGIQSGGVGYIDFGSTGQVTGSISLPNGTYGISLAVSGFGSGSLAFGKKTIPVDLTGSRIVILNTLVDVHNNTLNITATDWVGLVNVSSPIIVGPIGSNPDLAWLLYPDSNPLHNSSLQLTGFRPGNYDVSISLPQPVRLYLLLAETFYMGWQSAAASTVGPEVRSSGMLADFWSLAFFVGNTSRTTVRIMYVEPLDFVVCLIVQWSAITSIAAIAVFALIQRAILLRKERRKPSNPKTGSTNRIGSCPRTTRPD